MFLYVVLQGKGEKPPEQPWNSSASHSKIYQLNCNIVNSCMQNIRETWHYIWYHNGNKRKWKAMPLTAYSLLTAVGVPVSHKELQGLHLLRPRMLV